MTAKRPALWAVFLCTLVLNEGCSPRYKKATPTPHSDDNAYVGGPVECPDGQWGNELLGEGEDEGRGRAPVSWTVEWWVPGAVAQIGFGDGYSDILMPSDEQELSASRTWKSANRNIFTPEGTFKMRIKDLQGPVNNSAVNTALRPLNRGCTHGQEAYSRVEVDVKFTAYVARRLGQSWVVEEGLSQLKTFALRRGCASETKDFFQGLSSPTDRNRGFKFEVVDVRWNFHKSVRDGGYQDEHRTLWTFAGDQCHKFLIEFGTNENRNPPGPSPTP